MLAAAYGLLGKQEEAARALEQFERVSPGFDLEHLRNFLPDEAVERYYDGLRAAGWGG